MMSAPATDGVFRWKIGGLKKRPFVTDHSGMLASLTAIWSTCGHVRVRQLTLHYKRSWSWNQTTTESSAMG